MLKINDQNLNRSQEAQRRQWKAKKIDDRR